MKKFMYSIMLLSSCFTIRAMFSDRSSLSQKVLKKLDELELYEVVEDEQDNLINSILLEESSSEEKVPVINLEDSIITYQDDDTHVDIPENQDFDCLNLLKQKLLNFLKKCETCCSCFCSAFLLSCAKYGEHMGGRHYQRME